MKQFKIVSLLLIISLFFVTNLAFAKKCKTWCKVSSSDMVTVYNRKKPGSAIKELKAIIKFDAPNHVVKNVIDDVSNYKDFMPYTKESKLIKKGKDFLITYQMLSPPIVSNRDYTIKIYDERFKNKQGKTVYHNRWEINSEFGPKPIDGVVRVETNLGYWRLEPENGGKSTKATYYIFTNPGGSLPNWLINKANKNAIYDLATAVAKAAKLKKYNS